MPKGQAQKKPKPGVQVVEIRLPPMPKQKRYMLHIEAGEPGTWEPTEEELSALTDMFLRVIDDPKGGIVCTRTGVRVKLIALPNQE